MYVLKLFQIGKISEAINNLEIITKKEKENFEASIKTVKELFDLAVKIDPKLAN